ncbi:hypothetical protein HQ560_15210, partial [bacterium]|nr:hypothetical protein [bacterium]
NDWSFGQRAPLAVSAGQVWAFGAWVRVDSGSAQICCILRDSENKVLDWSYAPATTGPTQGWKLIRSRFVIPQGAATLLPRLIGYGPARMRADDLTLVQEGTVDDLRDPNLPKTLDAQNATLHVRLDAADLTLAVTDRRIGHTWRQKPKAASLVARSAKAVEGGMDVTLVDPASLLEMAMTVRLADAEVIVSLSGKGTLGGAIAFPAPFVTGPGTFLVMPVNEGISYPVDDASLPTMHYHLYGGHGLCMPWWGVTDGARGMMAIVETADDAAVRTPRIDGRLCLAPQWLPQKGQFGPTRVIRYVFQDQGGYVAMAKRYRQHAKDTGLFRTLADKRKANPHVDLLVGAVNVWCWDRDAVSLCKEMQAAGIQRILWSNRRSPEQLAALNTLPDVLTSRYDIYQDSMDPKHHPKLRWKHPDWTGEAWAKDDIATDAAGDWVRGWKVKAKNGDMIPCGVLCDRQAPAYARTRIPAELATHPYRSRFIDTTTASPWRECYHPKHPMTRTESKRFKMELLRVVSEENGLICGSETGHDAAVPVVHYFEGMLSLGPYRVPDSGRDMMRQWDEVPERVATFQTGHRYRLPLWELVYHDCVVAQWYWGDYNNKLPSLWRRRDLWNALYGTPPMFMFDRARWKRDRARFVESYRVAAPVARATGYAEMLSHQWLTKDHAVQQTRFADGTTVTVNFGDTSHALPDGSTLAPLTHRVTKTGRNKP